MEALGELFGGPAFAGLSLSALWPQLLLLMGAAFFAGFVDAIVGGGGLIQIPALFSVFGGLPPALLLGTNKVAGVFGTSAAAVQYVRRVAVPWNAVLPATVAALICAFLGAYTVTRIPPDFLRTALPFILLAVAVYTFWRKDFGQSHRPVHDGWRERSLGAGAGGVIGFYDGFFGPGTGSFLMFVFVRFFGFDFLKASAAAKVVNVACNVAAITWFLLAGQIWFGLGLAMAVFNVAGSMTGSRLAIAKGAGFVRQLFLIVVVLLIAKTSYDAFLR